MKIYSQNNPQWKDDKIGKSRSTIGRFGCTLTCVGMLINKTPNEVNTALTLVGGFNADLIVWSKIQAAFPSLKHIRRGKFNDMSYIETYVDKYGACLVEVDFDGIVASPADMHWVVYIPGGKLWDPWDGKEYSRARYKIIKGFSSFEILESSIIPTMPTWVKGYFTEKGIDLDNEGDSRSKLGEIFDGAKKYTEAEKARAKAEKDLAEKEGDVAKWEKNYQTLSNENKRLSDDLADVKRQVTDRDIIISGLQARVTALEAKLPPEGTVTISTEQLISLKAKAVSAISTPELIKTLLKRLFSKAR